MKKIIYFLLIIILLAGIAGGAYMCLKHFGKIGSNTKQTETAAELTAADKLIGDWSLTIGEGDSAITFSNKTDVINVNDLHNKGKGIGSANSSVHADYMTFKNASETVQMIDIAFIVNPEVWNGTEFDESKHYVYANLMFKKDGMSFQSFSNIYENPLGLLTNHISEIEENVSKLKNKQLGTYLVRVAFVQREYFDSINDLKFEYRKSDEHIPGMMICYTIPVYYVG